MIRTLPLFNLAGVIALGVLCVHQWRDNSALNANFLASEKTRNAQAITVGDQAKTIQAGMADRDDLHQRLSLSESAVKENLLALDQMQFQRDELAQERDALKGAVKKWAAAVGARDDAIRKANAGIGQLVSERNSFAQKWNDLVTKYNQLTGAKSDTR